MRPTLDGFERWLRARGRADTTVEAYVAQMRRAFAAGDAVACIANRKLAPKTRHQAFAAVRAWAKFAKDPELGELLDDIELPPPDRKAVRRPLPREHWEELRDAVAVDKRVAPAQRAALEMIVVRGLRVGDVLRLTRHDIGQALRAGRLRFLAKGRKWIELSAKPVTPQLEVLQHADWSVAQNVAGIILSEDGEGLPAYYAARRRLERALRRVGKRIGLDPRELYMHRLRRTVVVEVLKRLKDDPLAREKASAFMGWRGKATIQEYIDYVGREEIDALDDLL